MPTLRHINVTKLFFLLFVLAVCTAGLSRAHASSVDLAVKTDTATHSFSVEVMRSAEDRARGLMHRKSLPAENGMLFDFGRNVIARMWMKNTYIPLDMIFIRTDGTIANIAPDTVPLSTDVLSSEGEVRFVLEINAGLSRQLGISKGDTVQLPRFEK